MTDGRQDSMNSEPGRDPRLDRLYGEAANEQPPAHLDAAILAAAHREAGARPRALSTRLRAWRVPVSIAAVVVVSVSLVTLVREEGGDQLMQPAQRDLYSAQERAASADPASPPRAAPAPEASKAPIVEQPLPPAVREDRLPAMPSERRQAEAPARQRAAEAEVPPPPAARPEPQPFASATLERRESPATPDATTGADVAARSGPRAAPAEDLAAPATRSAPGAAAQTRDSARLGEAAGAASGALRSPPAAAPAERPRMEARSAQRKEGPPADTASVASLIKELDAQPPGKWLERIETLRGEGRRAEADELLAAFKRRFPDHPIPAGMR